LQEAKLNPAKIGSLSLELAGFEGLFDKEETA